MAAIHPGRPQVACVACPAIVRFSWVAAATATALRLIRLSHSGLRTTAALIATVASECIAHRVAARRSSFIMLTT